MKLVSKFVSMSVGIAVLAMSSAAIAKQGTYPLTVTAPTGTTLTISKTKQIKNVDNVNCGANICTVNLKYTLPVPLKPSELANTFQITLSNPNPSSACLVVLTTMASTENGNTYVSTALDSITGTGTSTTECNTTGTIRNPKGQSKATLTLTNTSN